GDRREPGYTRGRMVMVEDGSDPREAPRSEHLLGVERAVRLPELRVALAGNLSEPKVARHIRFLWRVRQKGLGFGWLRARHAASRRAAKPCYRGCAAGPS